MSVHILDAMARGGFEEVLALHDRESGLRGFLAIHDTTRGPAFGGIRRWSYRDESEMLRDTLRLSKAMTRKCVLAELPAGGAKLVLWDSPDVDLEASYRYLGRVIEGMGGRYFTGPDVGTGDRELGWVSSETQYATRPDEHGPGQLVESTGQGVLKGMEAALTHLDGEVDWPARRVVIQGLGSVGTWLASELGERGVKVLGCDLDAERARNAAQLYDVELIEPDHVLEHPCDVFSPNALGGILHEISINRMQSRIVCGAANNVLAHESLGARLADQNILFVPDFVVSCGALVRGAFFHLDGTRVPTEEIGRRVGHIVERVLDLAAEQSAPPARVATDLADGMIRAARGGEPM